MASILLVDDTPELRSVMLRGLLHAGHDVTEAGSGKEALAVLPTGTFQVLITDIVMPEMEGLELIRAVRKANPGIRIIAMSGGGRGGAENYLELASRFGAGVTLEKPFQLDELNAAVEKVLATR